jgi:uncharacterized protein (DUF2236 family)
MSEPPAPSDRPGRPGAGPHEAGGTSAQRTPEGDDRDGDGGLFGPDSVTWRVHAEPLLPVAGLRALLLMALHPVTAVAFEEHWSHRDLWERMTRLTEYAAVTAYGSTTQAMFAASRVRAGHARVHGTLPTGISYSADDPQLLAWVHSCLIASFLEVTTRGGLALSGAEQDGYIAEQVKAAMLVGLEPDEVPHDRARLQDYFRVIKPVLECLPAARRAAAEVVATPRPGPGPGTHARPGWAGIGGLAFAALPPWGRRLYALPDLPGAAGLPDAATTVGLRALRTSLRGAQAVVPPLRQERHLRIAPERS